MCTLLCIYSLGVYIMSLSDTKLRSLLNKPFDSIRVFKDRDSMSVRVSPKGKIVFQYRYRFEGKQRRYDMGVYPALSLSDARKLVPTLRDIVSSGCDIKEYYSKDSIENAQPSLDDCIDLFMSKYVPKLRASTQSVYYYSLGKHAKGKIKTPVEDVTKPEWYRFFDEVEKNSTGYVAQTLVKQLKTCLRYCSERGFIKKHSLNDIATKSVGHTSGIKDRTPSIVEIKQILREIERSQCLVSTKNTVKFIVLTGARCGEVRKMELSDVDFENKLWTLPADKSKMNIKIIRPLAPQAITILKEQVELFSEFSRFVFPSATYQNAISSQTINKFCRAVRDRMNLESWTVHDFRRSISTILVDEGIEPYIAEKLLGHSLGSVFSIYNKSNFITEQLSAYTKWEILLTNQ